METSYSKPTWIIYLKIFDHMMLYSCNLVYYGFGILLSGQIGNAAIILSATEENSLIFEKPCNKLLVIYIDNYSHFQMSHIILIL